MKKIILGIFITGLGILNLTNAEIIDNNRNNANEVVGLNLAKGDSGDFLDNSRITTNGKNIFYIKNTGNGKRVYNTSGRSGYGYNNIYKIEPGNTNNYNSMFFWNEGHLVFHEYFNGNINKATTFYVDKFAKVTKSQLGNFTNYTFNKTLEEVLNDQRNYTHQFFGVKRGNDGNIPNTFVALNSAIIYCIGDGQTYYCASCYPGDYYVNPTCNGGQTELGGITPGTTIQDIVEYGLNEEPPFRTNTIINTACPTLENIENTYGLNKDICYAGYDRNLIYMPGENTIIQPGSGLTIFETREITSGGMNMQTWYDTYREYYKNIDRDSRPFEGRLKALLGIETVRQMYGKNKTSYSILNYCNIALYTGDKKNTTTCTASTGNFQLPITEAKPTPNDIIDSIVNNPPTIVTPGTGTVFKQILGEQGEREIRGSFQSIYTKLTELFHFRQGKQGVIPIYITRIILIIVLLKIFRK